MRTPHFLVPSYLMVLVLLTGTVVNGSPAVSSMVHAQSCEIKATWYDDPAQEDTRGVISQNTGLGQSFTIPATIGSVQLTSVSLDLRTANPTSPLTISVHADNNGQPGAVSASTTQTPTNISAEFVGFVFPDAALTLDAGTTYYLTTTVTDPTASYSLGLDTSNPTYAGGNLVLSQDQGRSWTSQPAYAALFQVWGYAEATTDTASANGCATEPVEDDPLDQESEAQVRGAPAANDPSPWADPESIASHAERER